MRKRGIKSKDDFFSGLRFALGNELPEPQLNKICIEISKHYGGECVYISKTYSRQLSVRNNTIKQEIQSGHDKVLVKESIDKLNATIKLNGGTFRDRSKEKTYDELTGEVCATQLDLETTNSLELYNNARALREKAAALQADADYQKSIGKLVDRDHVDKIIFERSRQFRDILMNCSRRVAPEVAPMTDIKQIEQLLEREFRAVLDQFSKLPVVE